MLSVKLEDLPHDKKYRMNSLYRIIDRDGNDVKFNLNAVQEDVLDKIHTRNLILKARQLGMSTFSVLYLLDECIWTPNLSSGIVSYSLEHAQHIFKRIIGHAMDHLPPWLRVDVINRSAREITFANGSVLRVDTTLRGGAYQLVLVSEFGKTCARNPQKAEEVITGTLQSVPREGRVIIESTGEGNDGYFAQMVMEAYRRGNDNISPLEYKLFFYPWMDEPSYVLHEKVTYDVSLTDYFNRIEKETNRKITQLQRNWYAVQTRVLGDKMRQEFPSTVSEAFLSSSDAYYFAEAVAKAYEQNRCLYTSLYDALLPVYVAMDIGLNDLTVIAFFQIIHGEIRVIDYYEDKNKDVDFYAKFLLQDKKYLYHTIFLPHDSVKRDPLDVENSYERDFRRLFSSTGTKFHVLKKMDKQMQISHARIKIERCVFNVSKVKIFLDQISKYRKKWNESTGRYQEEPYHNVCCFIGETLVNTDKGDVRIDQIKIGDLVLTPSGYKKVLNTISNKTNKLVTISNEKGLITCTPHHKIFTNKGLITADSLRYNDYIMTIEDYNLWKTISFLGLEKGLGFKDYFLSMNQKQLSSLMDINIKKTNLDIGWVEVQDQNLEMGLCIGLFGNIKKVKFLKNMMFTILTVINQTIQSKIFNLFPTPITCACTCPPPNERNYLESILEKPLKLQNLGIVAKKGLNGIVNMEKSVLKRKSLLINLVITVKRYFKRFKTFLNTVLQHVNLLLGVNQVKITKKDIAKYVMKNLFVIDMIQKSPVLQVVEQCLDIEKEVYDLTIESDHCYFANGFLVSNSNYADCFQYLCQAVSHLETANNMGGALEKHRKAVESRSKNFI